MPRIVAPKLPQVDIQIEEKVITATSKSMSLPPGHAKALAKGLFNRLDVAGFWP